MSPYPATMDELSDRFVTAAPYSVARQRLLSTFRIYADLVWSLLPGARLWVDGGFVTHKSWAAPQDVDVVIVAPLPELETLTADQQASLCTLLTLQGVASAQPPGQMERLQPMGGLIDGFVIVDQSTSPDHPDLDYWFDMWSRVKGAPGAGSPATRKGFVEVVNP